MGVEVLLSWLGASPVVVTGGRYELLGFIRSLLTDERFPVVKLSGPGEPVMLSYFFSGYFARLQERDERLTELEFEQDPGYIPLLGDSQVYAFRYMGSILGVYLGGSHREEDS